MCGGSGGIGSCDDWRGAVWNGHLSYAVLRVAVTHLDAAVCILFSSRKKFVLAYGVPGRGAPAVHTCNRAGFLCNTWPCSYLCHQARSLSNN
jgi:hypothetical protein